MLTSPRYVAQYVVEGHKFYDQESTLLLYRPCVDKSQTGELGSEADSRVPELSHLEPVDSSGWLCLAGVN